MPRKAKPTSRRSDRTKAAILGVARGHFARLGYERGHRAIAEKARIDPAMVMRYFGTKRSWFAAAGGVRSTAARPGDRARGPRRPCWWGLPRPVGSDDSLQALLRAATSNKVAVGRLRDIFATQVMPAVAPLSQDRATARPGSAWSPRRCWEWHCAATCCGCRR